MKKQWRQLCGILNFDGIGIRVVQTFVVGFMSIVVHSGP
jgi:hypothetical protein